MLVHHDRFSAGDAPMFGLNIYPRHVFVERLRLSLWRRKRLLLLELRFAINLAHVVIIVISDQRHSVDWWLPEYVPPAAEVERQKAETS